MPQPVLVIGAVGTVGSQVVKALLRRGIAVRAADLDQQASRHQFDDEIDAVRFDFGTPATIAPALAGIKRMFLLRPPKITDVERQMFPTIDAARAAGVEQVVFLSLMGVEQHPNTPHYKLEQRLRNSGMNWTFLRCSFFMQNLNTIHRDEIRQRSEIFVPVGKGKTSFIDVRDIGEVAALALTQEGHANQAYTLTGPQALDYYQVAELFSQILGRKITYRNPSGMRFIIESLRRGRTLPYTLVMAWLYDQTRRGMSAYVTAEAEHLLGRSPATLEKYIKDHHQVWMPDSQPSVAVV